MAVVMLPSRHSSNAFLLSAHIAASMDKRAHLLHTDSQATPIQNHDLNQGYSVICFASEPLRTWHELNSRYLESSHHNLLHLADGARPCRPLQEDSPNAPHDGLPHLNFLNHFLPQVPLLPHLNHVFSYHLKLLSLCKSLSVTSNVHQILIVSHGVCDALPALIAAPAVSI